MHVVKGHVDPAASPPLEMRILGVEEHHRNPKLIDTRRTMATKLSGKRGGALAFLFIKKTNAFSMLLFAAALAIGVSSCFGILRSEAGWFSFVALFHTINFWFLASPHLLKKLLFNFDIWYLLIQSTLALVGLLDMFMFDGRVGIIITWWFNIISCLFVDAAHVSSHKLMPVSIAMGLLCTALYIPCVYFNLFPNIQSRDISIGQSGISINNLFFITDRLSTVSLFLFKYLVNAVRHPNCYINLKASINCEKVTAEELDAKKGRLKLTIRKLSILGSQNTALSSLSSGKAQGEPPNDPDTSNESSQHEHYGEKEIDIVSTDLNFEDDDLVRVVMVEQEFMGFTVMNSRDTMCVRLFGKNKGDWAFAVIKRTGFIFSYIWLVALVLALACLFAVVPDWVGYISFSVGSPFLLTFWLFCNPHRLWWLICTFEACYLTTLTTMSFGFAVFIFQHDGRSLALIFFWACTTAAIFFDAGHPSLVKHSKMYFFVGVAVCSVLAVSLHLGAFPSVDDRNLRPKLFGVEATFNIATLVTDKLAIATLFFCKNAFNAWRRPGRYTNLKARIKHQKMRVRELRRILQSDAASVTDLSTLLSRTSNRSRSRTSPKMRGYRQKLQRYVNGVVIAPVPVTVSVT